MEKKEIKISLGTFVVSMIVIILVIIIVAMGFYISNQNKLIEKNQIVLQDNQKELEEEKIEKNEDEYNSQTIKKSTQITTNDTQESTSVSSTETKAPTTSNSTKAETSTALHTTENTSVSKTKIANNNEERKNYIIQTASSHGGRILSNDIDYNLVLKSRVDNSKKASNVSNYASAIKWDSKNDSDFKFKYPSDWKVESQNNGVERYRISGKSIGKIMLENGENGNEVVESDMVIIVYEPVIFENGDMSKVTWSDDGYNGLGAEGSNGLSWTQVMLDGENARAQDNYVFVNNNGTKKLIKFRILTPNSNLCSYKETNIANYFLGEFKV